MAAPSVTYTFSNSTTADASQVNQNFTDIINGISDGTKDLSINALTVAGNATFSGNTTLGNATGDDITFTGSVASTVPIKTTNSYDIGTSSIGLRALYFGANSQTVNLKGSGSMSATWTFTLPVSAGTDKYFLQTNGSGVSSWQPSVTMAELQFDGFAGNGSTATKIPYFTTQTVNNTNSILTVTSNDSTNGLRITANKAALIVVTFTIYGTTSLGDQFGVSKNASSVTTNIASTTDSEKIAYSQAINASSTAYATSVSATCLVAANDVIRPHTSGFSGSGSATDWRFQITAISAV